MPDCSKIGHQKCETSASTESKFLYCKVWLHGFLVLLLMELLCEFGKIYSTVHMGKMEKPLTKDKIQPDLTSM